MHGLAFMYPASYACFSYASDSAGGSRALGLSRGAFPLDAVAPDGSARSHSRKPSSWNSPPRSVDRVCAASSSEPPRMDVGVRDTTLLFQTRPLAGFSLTPPGAPGTAGPIGASSE